MRFAGMRVLPALALGLVAVVALGEASRWKKPYFGATKVGAFARFHGVDSVSGDATESVLTRLADDKGRVVFERKDEYTAGKFKGTKNVGRYAMKAGFPMETEGLSYMRWAEKVQLGAGSGKLTVLDAATVKAIASQGVDYGAIVVFKGSETIDGKACDRYSYSYEDGGNGKVEGELWLSDQVPFGAVRQTTRGKDATGASYSSDSKLVESGVSAPAPAPAKAGKKAPAR
jgi:hypothetical protein